MLWGIVTFIFGQLVAWMERQGKHPPALIGWELMTMNFMTITLYPKGGFWFVLIPAFLMIKAAGRREGDISVELTISALLYAFQRICETHQLN
jgi:Family of unknown function (DUF6463)